MQAVKELRVDSILAVPRSVDWTSSNDETGERLHFYEAIHCDECRKIVVVEGGCINEHHRDFADSDCYGSITAEGPMMNYFYPLPARGAYVETVRELAHTNLCLVELDGEWGLALTGGGMDFSWEICEAYMRLGQLPPFHFTDLPHMAGRGISKRDRWIMAGCRRSCQVLAAWARGRISGLRNLAERVKPPQAKVQP